ncbi:MAG: UbiH/UbiF/VisC/COQ6 family ubiquinone biosynthesis hydroxylase [Pseudomonadota bacterium]
MQQNDIYDAAVIGGGLSGLTAAAALAHRGFSIVVADPAPKDALLSDAYDGRVTAIAYAGARMYRRLGVWDDLEAHASPINDILVTDGQRETRFDKGRVSGFRLHFDRQETSDGAPLGWIVENRHLRRALFKAAETSANIRLIFSAGRRASRFLSDRAEADLENGETLAARLLVAADGRRSALREEAGIKSIGWSYPQTGIVTTVAHEAPHKGVAQEYFLPSGPFAILPMADETSGRATVHRSSLVWTERTRLASALLDLDAAAFNHQLKERFGPYLGAVEAAGPRWSYPLSLHIAQSFIAPRLALVGDAAHGIHPIAGQGFNLGLKDIAALTEVLGHARRVGLDIGHLSVLERYQRWRRFDTASLAFGTDILNRLYSNDIAPVRALRDVGMALTGKIAPLSRFFMRHAGADIGDLPELMKA